MYSDERLYEIFSKTECHCRHCRKQLSESNYGARGARGGWEVDHSIPISRGGSENLRNLWPVCWQCNLLKNTYHGKYFDNKFENKTIGGFIAKELGLPDGTLGSNPRRNFRG